MLQVYNGRIVQQPWRRNTEDVIGNTVEWAQVWWSNQLWWIKAVSFILSSHLLFGFLTPPVWQLGYRFEQAISFSQSISGWLWFPVSRKQWTRLDRWYLDGGNDMKSHFICFFSYMYIPVEPAPLWTVILSHRMWLSTNKLQSVVMSSVWQT